MAIISPGDLIAIDVDEVLIDTTPALIKYLNEKYRKSITVEDLRADPTHEFYNWFSLYGISNDELTVSFQEMMRDHSRARSVPRVKGSREVLESLNGSFPYIAITSRGSELQYITIEQLSLNFTGLIPEVYFTNQFGRDNGNEIRTKPEIMHSKDARLLIDDSKKFVIDAADQGLLAILFDHRKMYPDFTYKNVHVVNDWQGVYYLLA